MNDITIGSAVLITGVNRDALVEAFGNSDDLYNDDQLKDHRLYIGSVGVVIEHIFQNGSQYHLVKFMDGEEWMFSQYDVELTDKEITPMEKAVPKVDKDGFRALTNAEKEFADKVFLALVARDPHESSEDVWNIAIVAAVERTRLQSLLWNVHE